MARLSITWSGTGIERMEAAMEKLAGPRRVAAARRALNHTGDKVFTAVRREVSKQVGLPQKTIVARGRLKPFRATGGNLTHIIRSSGRALSLSHFKPRQLAAGTKASPWGRRQMFKHAFMGPRPGVIAPRLGGHVWVRKGSSRMPIKFLYGPSIPKELVRDESAAAFARVSAELPARVEHEVKVITDGVLS